MLSICKKLLRIKNHRSGNLCKNCVIYDLLHSPNLVGYPRVKSYLKFTTWKPFKIFSNLKKFVISTSMSFPWKFGLHWLFTRGEFQVIPYPGTGFWLKEFEMVPSLWRANNLKSSRTHLPFPIKFWFRCSVHQSFCLVADVQSAWVESCDERYVTPFLEAAWWIGRTCRW